MQFLYLSSNELIELDPELFRNNPALTVLHLNGNKIEKISNELLQPLTKLKELFLNDNRIRSIGRDAFKNLTLPVDLNLSNNICVSRLFELKTDLNFDKLEANLEACFNNHERNKTPNESSSLNIMYFAAFFTLGVFIVARILNE